MPSFRLAFWARFALTSIGLGAVFFCVYVMGAVLFSSPAPLVPAFDISPNLTAQAQAKTAETAQKVADAGKANAEQAAARTQKLNEMAAAGGIKDADAIQPFFAKADMQRGKLVFARCAACHTATKGGMNRVGPNLWGIVGRQVASHPGFSYSVAMKAFAQKQGHWDLAALDKFFYKPSAFIPGTLMSYAGVRDPQERADLLLYLESLSDTPPQMP